MAENMIEFARLEDFLAGVIDQRRRLLNPWVHLTWQWEGVPGEDFTEVWIRASAAFPGETWVYGAVHGRQARGDVDAVRASKQYAAEVFESAVEILRSARVLIHAGRLARR